MRRTVVTIAAVLLAGCSYGSGGHHSMLVGVPLVTPISFSGSAAQITDDLAVTAAHNVHLQEVVRGSERYDAELIRMSGEPPVGIADPVLGETLTVYGTGLLGIPAHTEVRVINGGYFECVNAPYDPALDRVPGPCTAAGYGYHYAFLTERGGIAPGYSGGGAYNTAGDLVGMVHALGRLDGAPVAILYRASDLVADLMPTTIIAQERE